ncbi:MAG: UDP-N-acetylmuramate--L-alanine ligase [Planctomycetota bacterium]
MTLAVAPENLTRHAPHPIPGDFEKRRLHLVGVGGCGMSGLAALLLRRGARVTGSDARPSAEIARLVERGAAITTQQRAESVPPDAELVVASAAIPADHPELLEARRRGLPVCKYAQMLGAVMARLDGIAIAGTHGKSTTTAWLTFVLRCAGLDPSFVVGATVPQLGGGSGDGAGRHFIAEACEYDRSFLNLRPHRAAILNIEEDHLDCYKNIAEIRTAFALFATGVAKGGLVVLNGRDRNCRSIAAGLAARVEYFGDEPDCTWRATDATLERGSYAFTLEHEHRPLGRVHIGLSGRHNVDNACAVAALAHDCGVSWEQMLPGLREFRGADRRLTLRGDVRGVRVVDDYAHHPTEIRATLQAARERFAPRRLWCIFQPHQHSRTRFLLADFARSFVAADAVVVPDIYFVRDSQREKDLVRAADLVRAIRASGGLASYVPQFADIVDQLAREAQPGDVIMTMGAGNIWKVADELVERLGADLPA